MSSFSEFVGTIVADPINKCASVGLSTGGSGCRLEARGGDTALICCSVVRDVASPQYFGRHPGAHRSSNPAPATGEAR